MALQVKAMRRAIRLARHFRRSSLLVRLHAERQQHKGAEGKEQEIDRDDRAEFHGQPCATWSIITSTSGFLPVHRVAQRRTASRTDSRTASSLTPGLKR